MDADARCAEVRELAPELALGIASGDERARALDHLSDCSGCRAHLTDLAGLADQLLLLAPAAEPPAGFESRVLDQLPTKQHSPRARRPRLAFAAGAFAAALATALLLIAFFADDRRLADDYRDVLAASGGRSLSVTALHDGNGAGAGHVLVFDGEPSWVFVTVTPDRIRRYRCEVVTRDGRRIPMTWAAADRRTGSWGGATPVPLSDIRAVELRDRDGGEPIVARLAPE